MQKPIVTLTLPTKVYRRFARAARETNRSINQVLLQSIRGNLPPVFDDLPKELREEFRGMANFPDDELWAITQRPPDQSAWRKHRRLLELNTTRDLKANEAKELEHLQNAMNRYVLKKSFALALLKWRGYAIPVRRRSKNGAS